MDVHHCYGNLGLSVDNFIKVMIAIVKQALYTCVLHGSAETESGDDMEVPWEVIGHAVYDHS